LNVVAAGLERVNVDVADHEHERLADQRRAVGEREPDVVGRAAMTKRVGQVLALEPRRRLARERKQRDDRIENQDGTAGDLLFNNATAVFTGDGFRFTPSSTYQRAPNSTFARSAKAARSPTSPICSARKNVVTPSISPVTKTPSINSTVPRAVTPASGASVVRPWVGPV
jgi:hypothetical protein